MTKLKLGSKVSPKWKFSPGEGSYLPRVAVALTTSYSFYFGPIFTENAYTHQLPIVRARPKHKNNINDIVQKKWE